MTTVVAFFVVVLAVWALIRRADVRLTLFLSGFALSSLAGLPLAPFDAFQATMGEGSIIAPICCAMGYAFVLRATGCDSAMVRVLTSPLRHIRWALIPGGCLVGFVTNMAITSQTASAAAVGPILVPALLAGGIHPIIAAATLVLGCSGGGNLFNPGEPDIVAIHSATGAPVADILNSVFLPELVGFGIAAIALTFMSRIFPPTAVVDQPYLNTDDTPIQWSKALLPPLPIIMLLLLQPGLNIFPSVLEMYPQGLPIPHAMIIASAVVMIVHRREFSKNTEQFFEGLGYGFSHVISLIIAATCFIAGLKAIGAIESTVSLVSGDNIWAKIGSGFAPWILAVLSGSGTAPSVAFSKAALPSLAALNSQSAVDIGLLGAIGATFGRTMSPVAAVVIFSAGLLHVKPEQIAIRTAPVLLLGFIGVLSLMILL